jgi:hypothetical protein
MGFSVFWARPLELEPCNHLPINWEANHQHIHLRITVYSVPFSLGFG